VVLQELEDVIHRLSGTESIALEELIRRTRQPLFTLSVTGPSRVGKSTLINALLGRAICPMGDLPKTSVPATFSPSDTDSMVVTLRDGSKVHSEPTMRELGSWVTVEENPDNRKNVRNVQVTLRSDILDLGFAIVDLPGLDDPNDEVRGAAALALEISDAIIYVMNGGAFASGSFLFTNSDRRQLQELVPRMKKAFIALNKSDLINEVQRSRLKDYLMEQFKKFELIPLTDSNLFFVSASSAEKVRCEEESGSIDDGFLRMEEEVTNHMLQNGLAGRSRLRGILAQAATIVQDHVAIASLALARVEEAERLESSLPTFAPAKQEVERICSEGLQAAQATLRQELEVFRTRSIERFRQALTNTPLSTSLPDKDEIRNWIQEEVVRMVGYAQSVSQAAFQQSVGRANAVLDSTLRPVRQAIAAMPGVSLGLPLATALGPAADLNFWTPFWGTLGLGVFGLIFGPVGALVGALAGLMLGLFIGEQERRQREIRSRTVKVESILAGAADVVFSQMRDALTSAFRDLAGGLVVRLDESHSALKRELEAIGQPPSPARLEVLRSAQASLGNIFESVRGLLESL
jgi:GTP-binding protein EngB required for normal cell division